MLCGGAFKFSLQCYASEIILNVYYLLHYKSISSCFFVLFFFPCKNSCSPTLDLTTYILTCPKLSFFRKNFRSTLCFQFLPYCQQPCVESSGCDQNFISFPCIAHRLRATAWIGRWLLVENLTTCAASIKRNALVSTKKAVIFFICSFLSGSSCHASALLYDRGVVIVSGGWTDSESSSTLLHSSSSLSLMRSCFNAFNTSTTDYYQCLRLNNAMNESEPP